MALTTYWADKYVENKRSGREALNLRSNRDSGCLSAPHAVNRSIWSVNFPSFRSSSGISKLCD